MDKATIIIAISRSHFIDREDLYSLDLRQTTLLIDLLHEFSFVARKAIERADKHSPGVIDYTKNLIVHHPWTVNELSTNWKQCPTLTQQKFWWIANRIVHSRDTLVKHRDIILPVELWPAPSMITSQWTPTCFGFQSDYDNDREMHYVHIESYIKAYVGGISPKIEHAIEKRNRLE